jgi:hypothetical protein
MAINDKNASINELILSYLLRFFISLTMEHIGSIDGGITRHKLALILPMIEAVGASVICLSHTLAYFNPLNNGCHHSNFFCSGSLPLPRP